MTKAFVTSAAVAAAAAALLSGTAAFAAKPHAKAHATKVVKTQTVKKVKAGK